MQVLCGQCGEVLEVKDSLAGSRTPCIHCGHLINVPAAGAAAPQPPPEDAAMEITPEDLGQAPEGEEGFADMARHSMQRKVRITCGQCKKLLVMSARFSGKKVKCPACGTMLQIPYPDDERDLNIEGLRDAEEYVPPVEAGEEEAPPREAQDKPFEPSTTEPETEGQPEATEEAEAEPRAPRGAIWPYFASAVIVLGMIAALWGPGIMEALRKNKPVEPGPIASNVPSPGHNTANTPSNTVTVVHAGNTGNIPTNGPSNVPSNVPPANNGSHTVGPPKVAGFWVQSASSSLFAADGYYPARPGALYAKVSVRLEAGDDDSALTVAGDSVALVTDAARYPSLGLASAESASGGVPQRSVGGIVAMGRGTSRDVTFLFEVPAETRQAKIEIRGLNVEAAAGPRAAIVELPLQADVAADALVGTFVEHPPRNLRPMFKDPVMAAVQAVGDQKVLVKTAKAAKDTFEITIPDSGVSGVAKPAGSGFYDVTLRSEKDELKCKLRLADGGKTLLLYLSEDPFHQITYARQE